MFVFIFKDFYFVESQISPSDKPILPVFFLFPKKIKDINLNVLLNLPVWVLPDLFYLVGLFSQSLSLLVLNIQLMPLQG